MSRQGRGWCPFADQIEGITSFDSGFVDRVGWCDHTASGYYSTLTSPDFWNNEGLSVHFAIALDGRIAQLLNIFDTAYSQGLDANGNDVNQSSPNVTYKPFAAMNYGNPNGYLISTEHEDRQVTNLVWPEAMYQADLRVKRWCVEECKTQNLNALRFNIDSLAGHYMFDPVNRAYCPGNNWPRERLYNDLVGEPLMIRKNGVANPTFWHGRTLGGRQTMNAAFDFNLPPNTKAFRLEVLMTNGNLTVYDGAGNYAGQTRSGYGMIDVYPKDGWITLDGTGVINILGIVGYWI